MSEVTFRVSPKQKQAIKAFADPNITEILFGGGAGGGKTYWLCLQALLMAKQYPGSRGMLGRTVLKHLKQTTLLTLFDLLKSQGMILDIDYKYDVIGGVVSIPKLGSSWYLKDLEEYPSDPEFDSLGSTEFTYELVDEAQQLSQKAFNVLKTRLRYKTKEFGIPGKIAMTCNPARNFLRTDFYTPFIKGTLPSYRVFIPSLVTDNPYVDHSYIQTLERADDATKQRLLYGNWDYENDPNQLVLREWIENALVDPAEYVSTGIKTATLDVAREGNDKIVDSLMHGKYLKDMNRISIPINANIDISGAIADAFIGHCHSWGVGYQNTRADAIGNGGGVIDASRARAFPINEYKSSDSVNTDIQTASGKFRNMRAYSYWQIRLGLQSGEIKINKNLKFLEELIEELTSIHYDSEDKITIESKDTIKERIGRSTDHADSFAMHFVTPPMVQGSVSTDYLSNKKNGGNPFGL